MENTVAELVFDSILEGTDSGDLQEVDNNAYSSPNEDALNSSSEEEIGSSEHSGDKKTGDTRNASLKSGDTPSNKEDSKAVRATKPTSEESSSQSRKRKRGPYKCKKCGQPKLVKAPNGQLIPHLCEHLKERVQELEKQIRR